MVSPRVRGRPSTDVGGTVMALRRKRRKSASDNKLTPEQLAHNAKIATDEHRKVIEATQTGFHHAVAAGTVLIACKATVGHGGWAQWLHDNCREISERSDREYRWAANNEQAVEKAAAKNGGSAADLSFRGARKLLAKPPTP